jgi:hypothetical protein
MRGARRAEVTTLMLLLGVPGVATARPDVPLTLVEERALKTKDSFK